MSVAQFQRAFDRVIGHEGKYVNNPKDPGGETKYGISRRSYPYEDIKNLTRQRAYEIYERDFWNRLNDITMSDGILYQLFDFAVNSGIGTAIRHLQKAVGAAPDGYWGPKSNAALHSGWTEADVIMRLLGERLNFMTYLSNWEDAGKGWARRIAGQLRYGSEDS